MTDFATLDMKIDSTDVGTGVKALDQLTAAGARAEGQAEQLGSATAQTGSQIRSASQAAAQYAASVQRQAEQIRATGRATTEMGNATGLAAHHVQNLAFQLNDVAVGLASGQRPLTVFVQQGAQIAQIMQQAGVGVRGFVAELAQMAGIIKVTGDAELSADAAAAAAARGAIAAVAKRAAANIEAADTELALAEAAVRGSTSSNALAAAQERLALAHKAVAVAAAEAKVAEDALAVAQGRAEETGSAAAAASKVRIGAVGIALGAVTVAAATAFGAFKLFQSEVEDTSHLEKYAASLGLTKKEMKELKDVNVTAGDVFKGLWKTIDDGLGASKVFAAIKEWAIDTFKTALEWVENFAAGAYAAFAGTWNAMKILGTATKQALTGDVGGALATLANGDFADGFTKSFDKAKSKMDSFFAAWKKNTEEVAKGRVKAQADTIIGDRTPRRDTRAENLAREMAATEATIKGLYDLAAAYKVSDAAALLTETRTKATADAIKKQADAETYVSQQIRLVIAQRTAATEGAARNLNDQAAALEKYNDLVAAGVMTSEQANNALRDEATLRPALITMQAAQANAEDLLTEAKKKGTAASVAAAKAAQDAADKATQAYDDQAAALKRLNDANDSKVWNQYVEQAKNAEAVDNLILQHREAEAEVLERVLQLQSQVTDKSKINVDYVRQIVQGEHDRQRQIEINNKLIDIQVQAAENLQKTFEDLLTDPFGKGNFKAFEKSLSDIARRRIAQTLSVNLLGDMGADLRDKLTGQFSPAIEKLSGAGDAIKSDSEDAASAHKGAADYIKNALSGAADALTKAAQALMHSGAANDNGKLDDINQGIQGQLKIQKQSPLLNTSAFGNAVGGAFAKGAEDVGDFDLSGLGVTLGRGVAAGGVGAATGAAFEKAFDKVAKTNKTTSEAIEGFFGNQGVQTLVALTGSAFGKKGQAVANAFLNVSSFSKLGDTLSKQLSGTLGKGLSAGLGKAVAGVGEGLFSDSIVKALGIKGSATGGAIGGALGSVIGGPIGGFIGGALGSIVGGLFKKTKKESTTINFDGGTAQFGAITGNTSKYTDALNQYSGNISDTLNQIAQALGGTLNDVQGISVGIRHGDYRVDPTGAGNTKIAHGAIDFNDDAEAAAKYAIETLLERGVVGGISAASQRILASGQDLQTAIQKAVLIESIPKQLKQFEDPLGAAIDDLNSKWSQTIAVLKEAGASSQQWADAQKLYGYELQQVEDQTNQTSDSLKQFLDGLNYGSSSPLGLFDQAANAKSALQPYLDQINAGKPIDQSGFQNAASAFLDIERQIYGSTAKFFEQFDMIRDATNKAIGNVDASNVTPIDAAAQWAKLTSGATQATADAAQATAANTQTANEIAAQQTQLLAQQNALLQQMLANGGVDLSPFIGAARGFA